MTRKKTTTHFASLNQSLRIKTTQISPAGTLRKAEGMFLSTYLSKTGGGQKNRSVGESITELRL